MTQLRRKEREDDQKIRQENETLMREIIDATKGEKANNILLIGLSGAGKSAMLNTLVKVITGKTITRAKCGKGNLLTNSLDLTCYKHCGVLPDDVKNSPNEDKLQALIENLPYIFDFAGLTDRETPELEEKLKFLIGGFIKPGIAITALEKIQNDHGVGHFDLVFTKAHPEYKISKILFVHNCGEKVPKKLIKCLQNVTRATDEKTGALISNVDIYAVLTKYDMVENNEYFEAIAHFEDVGGRSQLDAELSSDSASLPDDEPFIVPLADFKHIENNIAQELAIVGEKANNLVRWISYSDTIGFDENPYITNIGLSFLKRMLVLGIDQHVIDVPLVSMKAKIKLACRKAGGYFREIVRRDLHLSPANLFTAFIALFVVYVMYCALTQSI